MKKLNSIIILLSILCAPIAWAGGIEVGNGKIINTDIIVGTQFGDKLESLDFTSDILRQVGINNIEQVTLLQERGNCNPRKATPKKLRVVEYYEILNMEISREKKVSALMEVQLDGCQNPNAAINEVPLYFMPLNEGQL